MLGFFFLMMGLFGFHQNHSLAVLMLFACFMYQNLILSCSLNQEGVYIPYILFMYYVYCICCLLV